MPRVFFREGVLISRNFPALRKMFSETDQTGFRTFALHYAGLSMLEATLSQMPPSEENNITGHGKAHVGCPCVLSSFCRMHLISFLPTGRSLSNSTVPVLLTGHPQTVFNPASVALPLRYMYITEAGSGL